MRSFIQAIWGGILSGSVYGLMALGLTLIWGAFRLLNLAHGALFITGAYVVWAGLNEASLPLGAALPAGIVGAGLMGYLLYLVFLRPMLGRPGWDSASIIATVGVAIALEAAALIVFGPRVKEIPSVVSGSFNVSGVVVTSQGLFVIGAAVISFLVMNAYLKYSRQGMAIRAVSQNLEAASLMGVPVEKTFATVMILSAALAGLAGVLLSSIFFLSPTSGFNPMLRALFVTIFGGLGSVKGTLIAAYVIGLLEAFLQVYIGPSSALPGLFVFMIAVLIIRPNGLFGVGEVRRL
jgi:branched-chain amino acid transport system permease protein